jgi:hypothetical protein
MNRPAQLVWKQPIRWWFTLLLIVVTTASMRSYGLATWPWEYDELASFMELGLYPPEEHSDYQLRTIVKFVPVWYALQHAFLSVLPHDELGSRILPALCGTLTVVGLSAFAYYHRGLGLAVALAVLLNGNVLLLHLSQVNRFYTLPLLFVALALMGIWARSEGFVPLAVTVGCAALAMLSHSLALIPFGIAALASTATWLLGWERRATAVRALSAAAVAGLIYLAWVRPNMEGWIGSAPQPGLHTLMSFASYLGIPTLALGLFGAAAALVHREARSDMAWWAISAAGVLLFMLLVPWLMPIWHPPYHLLFMLPFWITGAFATLRTRGNRRPWPGNRPGAAKRLGHQRIEPERHGDNASRAAGNSHRSEQQPERHGCEHAGYLAEAANRIGIKSEKPGPLIVDNSVQPRGNRRRLIAAIEGHSKSASWLRSTRP